MMNYLRSCVLLWFIVVWALSNSCAYAIEVAVQGKDTITIGPENENVLHKLGQFPETQALYIGCLEELKALPEAVGRLSQLKILEIDNGNGCAMNVGLPESIGNLGALKKLKLWGAMAEDAEPARPVKLLPKAISRLEALENLNIGRNQLKAIPEAVFLLRNIKNLDLSYNNLRSIPEGMLQMSTLEHLNLQGNDLNDLPGFIGQLKKLKSIDLGGNCVITQSHAKKKELAARFPAIQLKFENEYDCPVPSK